MKSIIYKYQNNKFIFKTSAIVINDEGRVLLGIIDSEININQSSRNALEEKLKNYLVNYEIQNLAVIYENIYKKDNQNFHEINFIYRVHCNEKTSDNLNWYPITALQLVVGLDLTKTNHLIKKDANTSLFKDCEVVGEKEKFRLRSCGIIIEDNKVLFSSNEVNDYLYSVGGGVHVLEDTKSACERETREETGIDYEIDRLLWISEQSFKGDNSFEGYDCEELVFYYLMKPKNSLELNSDSDGRYGKETMKWIELDKINDYNIFPNTEFWNNLKNIDNNIKHIIETRD